MDEIIASIKAEHYFHDHDLPQTYPKPFSSEHYQNKDCFLLLKKTIY
jgi:hypothetical protein